MTKKSATAEKTISKFLLKTVKEHPFIEHRDLMAALKQLCRDQAVKENELFGSYIRAMAIVPGADNSPWDGACIILSRHLDSNAITGLGLGDKVRYVANSR